MTVSVQSYEIMKGNGDSTNSIAWSISAAKWVATVSVVFVSTILICYAACLYQGHCGTGPWNSISHSWEHPPGSYASRFIVGTCSDMIAVFHGFLYMANIFASRQPNTSKKCCQCFTNEVLLGIGVFSVFCLSWVGAICDADTDPECKLQQIPLVSPFTPLKHFIFVCFLSSLQKIGLGNNTIHSTCAVLFFLLTDVVAGVLACDPKTEQGKKPFNRMVNMLIFIVMTCCTMVRICKWHCDIFGGPLPNDGDNFVIIAEVIEVSFFIVFMNTLAQTLFTGISWAVVTSSSPPSGQDLIIAISAKKIVYAGVTLVIFVLLSTYIIGEAEGQYSTELPLIGDMWVFKPNNWISRWSTVQATSAFIWVSIFSQIAMANNEWNNTDTGLVILQIFSLLSFAGSGIVDKSDGENKKWHDICAMCFYLSADLFVLLTVILDNVRYNRKVATHVNHEKPMRSLQLLAAVAVLTGIRYVFDTPPSAYDVLEWVDMIVVVAFFAVNCLYRVATSDMALAFLVVPPSSSESASSKSSDDKQVKAMVKSEVGISLL